MEDEREDDGEYFEGYDDVSGRSSEEKDTNVVMPKFSSVWFIANFSEL